MKLQRLAWLTSALLSFAASGAHAADIVRTTSNGNSEIAEAVSVDNLVFVSGVSGTVADPLAQVDEIVQKTHDLLARRGLGFGNMLQHTVYMKDGALQPGQVLERFHAAATRIAPSLKELRSVGTIVRVPAFANKNTIAMIDVIAGAPAVKGKLDDFKRIPFRFGPSQIVETIEVPPTVFTAGLEAMDFQFGKLPAGIDEQITVIVGKLQTALQKAGLSVGDMISHNLYVKRGTDPMHVIQKFHEATYKLAPELKDRPSVGTLVVVDGMAVDGFLLEMDAVAARPQPGKPDAYKRVPYEQPIEIARSVAVGDVVYLSGMEVSEGSKPIPNDAGTQATLIAKKIDEALRQSGLSIGDMVKYKMYVKTGQDAEKIRRAFLTEAARLAPSLKKNPSAETVVIVEGLANNGLLVEVNAIGARK